VAGLPPTDAEPCPGCGLVRPPREGPTHPYIGASPGCWAAFTQLIGQGLGSASSGQLVTDTYAAQHPGVPERRAIQSVGVHLVLLCATLERDWPADRAVQLRRRAIDQLRPHWRWLDVPSPLGSVTVMHVLSAPEAQERGHRVLLWARDVWAAYAPHQALVRDWLDELLR
jgi:hypothetical protein